MAFALRGAFTKLGAKDGEKVDINSVYNQLREMVPKGDRRDQLTGAIDAVVEKLEKDHKDRMELMSGLKALDINAKEQEEAEQKKMVLGAVGELVKDVKKNMEKASVRKDLTEEEVQLLLDAYKRIKHNRSTGQFE